MVTVEQIEKGIASYLDTELMPKLSDNTIQKVIAGTAIGLAIRQSSTLVKSYQNNEFVKMLGIFDEEGNVDIELVKDELIKNVPTDGFSVEMPVVGKLIFKKEDINRLYKHIIGGV
jgi:hypothetical protein